MGHVGVVISGRSMNYGISKLYDLEAGLEVHIDSAYNPGFFTALQAQI